MKPVTVLETTPFIRAAADCLSDEERQAFIDYIARNPEAGDLIQGTGGARKVRWARGGGGKEWRRPDDLLLPQGCSVLAR